MLDFYGTDRGDGALLLSSLLRRWFIRWDAEPFANFGTMLEFHVHRPPTEADDLIQLAVEQYVVASDTIVLPGIRLRDHARALHRRTEWFLHSRP